jgi:hypothetical protein
VCAQCRYPTGDITRLICPECGNDLRVVGILTPRIRARMAGSFLGVVLAWTLMAAFITMLAGSLMMNLGARWITTAHDAAFTPSVTIGPRSTTVVEVSEEFHAPERDRAAAMMIHESLGAEYRTAGDLAVVDSATGARAAAEIRVAGIEFGDGVIPFAQIDAALVNRWLADAGVAGATVPQIDAVVTALRFAETGSVIESLGGEATFMQSNSAYRTITTSRRGPLLAGSIAAVMFVVWILGIVRLARMMRIPPRGDVDRAAIAAQPAPPAPPAPSA